MPIDTNAITNPSDTPGEASDTTNSPTAPDLVYPPITMITNAVAAALQANEEPVLALADLADRLPNPLWHVTLACIADAVQRILDGEHPGRALEQAFEPIDGFGFVHKLGQALACLVVALEEGAQPERALQLASYSKELPEVAGLVALFGRYRWPLDAFSPAWQEIILAHVAPAT